PFRSLCLVCFSGLFPPSRYTAPPSSATHEGSRKPGSAADYSSGERAHCRWSSGSSHRRAEWALVRQRRVGSGQCGPDGRCWYPYPIACPPVQGEGPRFCEEIFMLDAVIVGAGPSGLAAAHELCKSGGKVIVLERMEQVGGLARTVAHDGC